MPGRGSAAHDLAAVKFIVGRLRNQTSRTTKKVFDEYVSGEDYDFSRTVVPVVLAQSHPQIELHFIHANASVRKMIARARRMS